MPTCPIGPTCLGCAKCDPEYHAKRAAKRARQLRTAIDPTPHPYAAPDSYERDLQALRDRDAQADAARTWPTPRSTEVPLDSDGIPDPYFHAIQERLREENKR